jgi:hypothetical protein
MSAFRTKQTSWSRSAMSAFGGKADMTRTMRCLLLTQSGHQLFVNELTSAFRCERVLLGCTMGGTMSAHNHARDHDTTDPS